MDRLTRRQFLTPIVAGIGTLGLAGCLSSGFPGGDRFDRTVYVGAYHWGFVVLDETGEERERVLLNPGTAVRIVAFNTSASGAVSQLPSAIRGALPDHEALEERNEKRIPTPLSGDMHEALEEANERYPDHSLAVMPSGWNHMRGPMDGGMMLHPISLPRTASEPTIAGLRATQRGDYTISCLAYCGYGHPYMDLDGAFVVR